MARMCGVVALAAYAVLVSTMLCGVRGALDEAFGEVEDSSSGKPTRFLGSVFDTSHGSGIRDFKLSEGSGQNADYSEEIAKVLAQMAGLFQRLSAGKLTEADEQVLAEVKLGVTKFVDQLNVTPADEAWCNTWKPRGRQGKNKELQSVCAVVCKIGFGGGASKEQITQDYLNKPDSFCLASGAMSSMVLGVVSWCLPLLVVLWRES